MQVSKEGIERIKAANELGAVLAERGVELRKRGRVLVARCPFHEEKTAFVHCHAGEGTLPLLRLRRAGDVIGFVTKHDKVSFGSALDSAGATCGPRPCEADGGPAADPAANTDRCAHAFSESPLRGPRPRARPLEARRHGLGRSSSLLRWSSTTTGPSASGRTRRSTWRSAASRTRTSSSSSRWATRTARSSRSIPKTGERAGRARRPRRHHEGGAGAPRRLRRRPDPGSAQRQWTTLYGRGLRTPRHCYLPGPLRGVLNFQAARSSTRCPHRDRHRRAVVPPGRHLDRDPDLRHERLHARTTSTC